MSNLNSAKKWLESARRDYDVAAYLNETFRPLPVENICYGGQQAVEKALKSILILHTGDAPKTHDIELLHELCKKHSFDANLSLSTTRTITRFATKSRYPDDMYEFTQEDAKLAIKYAKRVLNQANQTLNKNQEKQNNQNNQKQENRSDDDIEGDFLIQKESDFIMNKFQISARVNPLNDQSGNVKAMAGVTIDGVIAINNLTIVEGKNGLFVGYPQVKDKDDNFRDIVEFLKDENGKMTADALDLKDAIRKTLVDMYS